jgi:hypothetical protein
MADSDPLNLTFEDAMRELESIVRDLETGKAKLDDAVRAPFINTNSAPWAADELHFVCRVRPRPDADD